MFGFEGKFDMDEVPQTRHMSRAMFWFAGRVVSPMRPT